MLVDLLFDGINGQFGLSLNSLVLAEHENCCDYTDNGTDGETYEECEHRMECFSPNNTDT